MLERQGSLSVEKGGEARAAAHPGVRRSRAQGLPVSQVRLLASDEPDTAQARRVGDKRLSSRDGGYPVSALSDPASVHRRLEGIEHDLAERQNALEDVALAWFRAKREREKSRATAFLEAEGTVAERNAIADKQTADIGMEDEAAYEAQRAVVRVLDTRAAIGMAILKSQGRASTSWSP